MSSIIRQFDAYRLKYTFASSGAYSGTKEEDAITDSYFYSETNETSYWQSTFSQPVTATSYQICTSIHTSISYVKRWEVSYSNGNSLTFIQTNYVSSYPSKAVKFTFPRPITLKTLRITSRTTTNGQKWLRVGQFDLFGTTKIPGKASINYRNIRQRIQRTIIILLIQITTC